MQAPSNRSAQASFKFEPARSDKRSLSQSEKCRRCCCCCGKRSKLYRKTAYERQLIPCYLCCHWHLLCHDRSEVDDPLRVAPLVVVPHHDLHQVLTHDHCQRGVHRVGVVRLHEVAGHQRLLLEVDDALLGSIGSLLDRRIHILRRGLLAHLHHQVHHRDVGCGHAQRDAVELTFELWQDLGHGLSSTCACRDNIASACTGTAQITVSTVQDHLVPGVRVCGGHHATLHAKALVKDLAHRGHAVGRAGSVRPC